MWRLLLVLIGWLPAIALAQAIPPVQPQPGLQNSIAVEVRFKGARTATNPSPTLRVMKFQTTDAKIYNVMHACWNKTTVCPPVVAATVRVYLSLPWDTSVNVTRFVLCNASECLLPSFSPLVAKPGQSFYFRYNRLQGQWEQPPSVIPTLAQ